MLPILATNVSNNILRVLTTLINTHHLFLHKCHSNISLYVIIMYPIMWTYIFINILIAQHSLDYNNKKSNLLSYMVVQKSKATLSSTWEPRSMSLFFPYSATKLSGESSDDPPKSV
ncbi:hypothetical protein V8G54_008556 [Vigna mungo]|uniref:Uncharacterized protein n=1 Tax=Vigna mungo TaxID=3915 RepID=A0AAQ3S6K4_VIGMU